MKITIKKATCRAKVNTACRFFVFAMLSVIAIQSVAASKQSMEQRLVRMERLLANQNLIEMLTSLQALQQEVSTIRGDLDLLNHELSQIKMQQKDIYIDLDQRIQEIDGRIVKLQTSPIISPAAPSFDSANNFDNSAGAAVESALSKEQEYQSALAILRAGRYEEAIQAFQIYLISYPKSNLAANAQYWMAEAYYVLRDYDSSVSHFQKVITAYPDSRKIPDAHLKMGFGYYELQKWPEAKAKLETVVADYSESTAARLAERRLSKMKLEGHL